MNLEYNEISDLEQPEPKRANLGCGPDYRDGWFNVDIVDEVDPDFIYDLDDRPWPWPDNSFEHVLMDNVIEHLDDRLATLRELHRVTEPDGTIHLRFPHWNSVGHYIDPTHAKTIDHRMFWHNLVDPLFTVKNVSCTRVRFGRVFPEGTALWLADHIGHIVSEVSVTLKNTNTT